MQPVNEMLIVANLYKSFVIKPIVYFNFISTHLDTSGKKFQI